MRRSRQDIDPRMTRAMSPTRVSPPPPMPAPLDWERIGGPACCVCRQVYVAESGEDSGRGGGGSNNSNNNKHGPYALRKGGPGAGGEESFVVLPDSAPVLSEDYFTLARHQHSSSGSISDNGLGLASSATSTLSSGAPADTPGGGVRIAGGGSSLAPGSELLESRYSGYGGSGGFGGGGGWTAGSFGVGSSMLDSIVQISHAGLSDNVRRESLLYHLSKRPARWPSGGGGIASPTVIEAGGDEASGDDGDGDGDGDGEEEHDPTLCCHCYASLLEQIDEDTRLADREALAYRDFMELLDGVSAAEDGRSSSDSADRTAASTPPPHAVAAETTPGDKSATELGKSPAASSAQGKPRAAQDEMDAAESPPPSPYAQALRIAEQTSVQLRTELRSLEAQRGALCARGSEAWAALSELAYARGVLGDECRELLQVSREVAENAARLSEQPALSDLFSIRHVDGFPSINGYRLGRAPEDKRRLHWNEINAAWGEAILLVRCVSNAVDFRSRRFRLVPLNCASRVIELASGDNSGGLSQEQQESPRGQGPQSPSSPAAAATSVVVVCAHDLFSTGGSGGGRSAEEKYRYLAAVRAFLACSAEAIAFLERRVLERRLDGEMSAGAACVAWSNHVGEGAPYMQTEDAIGGVSIGALKSRAAWKAWLCQLVKNLEWAVDAASSLCVA